MSATTREVEQKNTEIHTVKHIHEHQFTIMWLFIILHIEILPSVTVDFILYFIMCVLVCLCVCVCVCVCAHMSMCVHMFTSFTCDLKSLNDIQAFAKSRCVTIMPLE